MPSAKKKIIMIALFPPPYSSGERILNMMNQKILETKFEVIALNVSTSTLHPERMNITKIKNQIHLLWLYLKAVVKAIQLVRRYTIHGLYMVTPGSRYGHIRDAIIYSLLSKSVKYSIAIIQNGHIDKVFNKSKYSFFTRKMIRQVDRFVFTSRGLYERVTCIPDQKKEILHNSIDPALIFTTEEVERKQIELLQPGPLRILYLSNMTPSKGFMDVASSIKILHQRGIQVEADFVGEWLSDEQLNGFKNFVYQHDLNHIIHIHGKINDRNLVKQMYQHVHFFVLPTYFTHEAQPVSIIEALNAGVPVISTNHASIPEMVFHGVNGMLVPPKNPEAIAAAIEQSMTKNNWLEMSNQARKTYDANFSRETYEQKLLNLFM